MKRLGFKGQLRPVVGMTAIMLAMTGMAHASNTLTEAGVPVSNTFTLSYNVGAVTQPVITNDPLLGGSSVLQGSPTVFTVDRKVDHSVVATNSILATSPGQTATLTFELTNEGNDLQAYSFSLDDLDSGAATFDATSLSVVAYVDADDDGDFLEHAPVTLAQTAIGAGSGAVTADVPKGARVLVYVVGTVPTGASDLDALTDDITLVAEARNPTVWLNEVSAAPGAVTAADAGANTQGGAAQNVLADDTGVADAESGVGVSDADGLYAATGIMRIDSPDLTTEKRVRAITEQPVDCETDTLVANAKSIPGACVEYIIEVENTGSTADAVNLVVSDILPAEVTFVSADLVAVTASGFQDDPAVAGTGPTLTAPTTPTASDCNGTTTCIVTLNDAILEPGEMAQVVIRALVK